MPAGCSKRDLPAWGWCKSQTTEVYQPDTQYSLHPSPYLTLGDQAGEISHTVINRVNNHRHNARHNDQPSGSRLYFFLVERTMLVVEVDSILRLDLHLCH